MYRGNYRKENDGCGRSDSEVERRWRETSNPNKGNSESDKSSGDLQPPGAFSVTRHEYNLRFFSREKEKDIHVLERVTRAGPRGRIQREAGKKNGIDIIIIGCRYYNFPFRTS